MMIDMDTILTVTFWWIAICAVCILLCLWSAWRSQTRRASDNLDRDDIARLCARRKEATR